MKFFIIILFIFYTSVLSAQKVGLVLSGGGAKGVAHIGVIKALEDNNIPIDYIAGMSIGAVIGGLYACGYTPDEMQELISSDEFNKWIAEVNDDKYTYYFKKEPPNASWVTFKFTYDPVFRTKLPTNLISPTQMDFAFMEIFSGASAASNYNFDSLFIPFRCVASDIADNKVVVLQKGYVGEAIRASMTFPFYFKPIRINGKLLFDGGMYNNFPSDVLFDDFSPDVIIGCKVASNYPPPKDDDLLSQIQSMLMENTEYELFTDKGVLIEPQLKQINIMDFSHARAFIDSGYVATMRKMMEIKSYVKDTIDKKTRNKKRELFLDKKPPLVINNFYINGLNEKQFIYVNKILRKNKFSPVKDKKQIKDPLTLEKIKPQYFKLITEDRIEYVYPKLKYDIKSGFYDLLLDIKKENKIITELGGIISSKAINEIFLQVQYNYWGKNTMSLTGNAYIGRFYNSAQIRARFDYPKKLPVFIETFFTYNQWNYFKTNTYFFEDENPSYLVQNENIWEIDMGIPATVSGKIVSSICAGRIKDVYYQTNYFSRLDTTDKTYFDFYSPKIYFELYSLNRKQFASSGIHLLLSLKFINGIEKNIPGSTSTNRNEYKKSHEWFQLRFKYDNYFETFGPLKLGFYGEALISNQPLFNNYTASVLSSPAFQPFPETKTLFLPDYRAHNYFALGLKNVFKVFKRIDFRIEGYAFQPFEQIVKELDLSATYGERFSKRFYMSSAVLVYHSPICPVSICLNYYDKSENPFSFMFNIGYMIFNKRFIND
ncbi:MAG: patatin-like phospholipase family protein [Bacteroidales bacterium]|nr:patatin-like phospholipase family protein [Bacteroidales bacterium]